MPKQPDCTQCPLLNAARIECDEALKMVDNLSAGAQNELAWLRQRIDELEDQLFVLTDCEPEVLPNHKGIL